MAENDEDLHARFREMGIAAVKADLLHAHHLIGGRNREIAWAWVYEEEEKQRAEVEERRREEAERSIAAAERSAKAAEEAADMSMQSVHAARKSARWTFWAAIIALVTVAVAVMPGCIERLMS